MKRDGGGVGEMRIKGKGMMKVKRERDESGDGKGETESKGEMGEREVKKWRDSEKRGGRK